MHRPVCEPSRAKETFTHNEIFIMWRQIMSFVYLNRYNLIRIKLDGLTVRGRVSINVTAQWAIRTVLVVVVHIPCVHQSARQQHNEF